MLFTEYCGERRAVVDMNVREKSKELKPKEHLGLPNAEDVKPVFVAAIDPLARIAASGDTKDAAGDLE